jgi:hypothetical protein
MYLLFATSMQASHSGEEGAATALQFAVADTQASVAVSIHVVLWKRHPSFVVGCHGGSGFVGPKPGHGFGPTKVSGQQYSSTLTPPRPPDVAHATARGEDAHALGRDRRGGA